VKNALGYQPVDEDRPALEQLNAELGIDKSPAVQAQRKEPGKLAVELLLLVDCRKCNNYSPFFLW
jgi:hypothetical protein